ncbi:MAG: DUF4387 family protein [Limimaricola sp.]|nr:DUF4387 family protein [Limimaricola sp.]
MPEIGQIAEKVRSKNAGPFWVTIDIFCGNDAAFRRIAAGLPTATVAALFHTTPDAIKRFDIADLAVVKFSLPRPQIQGIAADRDMHGAGWGPLVAEIEIA